MNYKKLAQQIIPGYETLSEEQLKTFNSSDVGKVLAEFIEENVAQYDKLSNASSWWDYFSNSKTTSIQAHEQKFQEEKNELLEQIKENAHFSDIRHQAIANLLKTTVKVFHLIDSTILLKLAQDKKTQEIFTKIASINYQLDSIDPTLIEGLTYGMYESLKNQQQQTITDWYTYFKNCPELREINQAIKANIAIQAILHAQKLADFFPLLRVPLSLAEDSGLAQLMTQFSHPYSNLEEIYGEFEEGQLTHVIYQTLEIVNKSDLPFINLRDFNLRYSNRMARAILTAFNNKESFDKEAWLTQYEKDLSSFLYEELKLINAKPWVEPISPELKDVFDSLSYLFSRPAEEAALFLKKLSDAHAFIQMTGGATQNENSYLAIFDIFNYYQYHNQINEAKHIGFSLFSFLSIIYYEYKDIAFHEKNNVKKFIRSLMPLLITTAVVVLIAVAVAHLALPELVFMLIFTAAVITGLVVAAQYLSWKDYLYKKVKQTYYGGPFEIPEFQVNERTIKAFGTKEIAEEIRKFYIEELSACDKLEAELHERFVKGHLKNAEEITLKKENLKRRHTLCLEWYDIHSNFQLGYENATLIALDRLKKEGKTRYDEFAPLLKKDVKNLSHELTEEFRTLLNNNEHSSSTASSTSPGYGMLNYEPRLFAPPNSFAIKKPIEKLDDLTHLIEETCSPNQKQFKTVPKILENVNSPEDYRSTPSAFH